MGCPTFSAAQCDDAKSDWYQWVTDAALIADGITYLSGDQPSAGPGFWETWPKYLDAARDTAHLNGLRTSIEWSRIFPDGAAEKATTVEELKAYANKDAVAEYHAIFKGAHDRGMQARFDREEDKAKGTNTALTVVALLITAGAGFADNDGSLGPTDTVPQPGGAPDSSPVWVQIVNHRTVDHYYTLEVADELIRAHNASLRRHLGLTLEEAQAQDARPVAAPAP